MHISIVSIFPEIFKSFLETSLIAKAQEKKVFQVELINPRDFCEDKHKQIDDEIYGGGAGMLMKAKPLIDAVESIVERLKMEGESFKILFLSPSEKVFDQKMAYALSECENLMLVCGRYEGIDHRFEEYMHQKYPGNFEKISLGKFVTLGGETPVMVMIEAITRLIPGVIKEEKSHLDESYNPEKNLSNIEYPQYTRPEKVFGLSVPEILLSGNHKKIEEWREGNEQ